MIDVISPHTNQPVGQIPAMSPDNINDVFEKAYSAYLSWRNSSIHERVDLVKKTGQILLSKKDEIAKTLYDEIGKELEDGVREVERSVEYMNLVAESAKQIKDEIYHGDVISYYKKGEKTAYVTRVPLGVVLAITPFNYPINMAVTKLAPALLAGNSVVLKPSTQGSLSATKLVECFKEAGMKDGLVGLITGNSSEIGDTVVTHPRVALIAFTGSTKTGKHIGEIVKGKVPLLMEMGGKDTALVLADADLELTAGEIVKGAFSYCGQRCTAVKRVFVEQTIADQLTSKIVEKAQTLKLGPVINTAQKSYLLELIGDASSKGAQISLNGAIDGNSIQPTVLTNVNETMRIFNEEQFGPILPITVVPDIETAIKWINSSPYALQADVFTKDMEKAMEIAGKIEVGTVQINSKSERSPDNFPFLGVRDSGFGPAQGTIESITSMSREKVVVVNKKSIS